MSKRMSAPTQWETKQVHHHHKGKHEQAGATATKSWSEHMDFPDRWPTKENEEIPQEHQRLGRQARMHKHSHEPLHGHTLDRE
jgi:hypothetical protein